jgi:dolichol-phosphate mannosyltransferase subunit 3
MLQTLGIKVSRGVKLSTNILMLIGLWWYLFNLELGTAYEFMISAVPYWVLVTFGSYALWKIGLGLYCLRDCVKESLELESEIKQAKEFLNKKGLKIH